MNSREAAIARLVITGGAGDLARAVEREFLSAGWLVSAPGRRECDVTSAGDVARFFERNPAPDLLVCNAGVTRDRLLSRQTHAEWEEVWETNFTGAERCARRAVEAMRREGRVGQVVLIGSYAGFHPGAGQGAYAASKAALAGLMQALASEWGGEGIRVNLVCPGFLETRMTAVLPEQALAAARDRHVLGRFTTPRSTARFLRFLHEEMPDVSGQCFSLDSRIL